jgi:nicotinamidase-related amidase
MKKVLIVVDIQNDFVDGSLGSEQAQSIIPNVKAKIEEYSKRGDQIIFTRDTHQTNYLETQEGKILPVEHCMAGTDGWNVYNELDKNCAGCVYIDKPTFGWPYWGETLGSIISEINEIEICGLCTDICVVSNALIIKAHFPEIKVTVDAGCCAGVTNKSHKAALLTMKMCQVNVINNYFEEDKP